MTYVEIDRIDHEGTAVSVVRMDDPDRRNALSATMVSELKAAFAGLSRDRATDAVVLTGAGGFCAGADLSGTPDPAPDSEGRGRVGSVYRSQEHIAEVMIDIHECEKPVVAAVTGAAVGGGLALALACDLRVAAPDARLGSVFINVGLSSCDVGTSYFLPRLIGPTRAFELMATGRHFSGEEADRFGMLNACVPEEEVLDRAVALAAQVGANNEYGVWMTKKGFWLNLEAPSLRHAVELENRTQVLGTFTGNMARAAEAFRDKRAPEWDPM